MTTRERIREIFLQPVPSYSLGEAATLLEFSDGEMIAAVEVGDLGTLSEGGVPRVPWEEIAVAAAERWPQDVIEEALGSEAS